MSAGTCSITIWDSEGPVRIVAVAGELDMDAGPKLKDELLAQAERQPQAIILDLSEVTFIDSSGLWAMSQALRLAGGCVSRAGSSSWSPKETWHA
jgi:anti-anti-sigma factor